MLPFMLHANDNLEALYIDENTGVCITHETHPEGEKIHSEFSSSISFGAHEPQWCFCLKRNLFITLRRAFRE